MIIKTSARQLSDGYLDRTPWFQYVLLSICFPMWGMAASLNDILITQFKSIFTLSDFASAFVQSAFYGGYFLIAIPASRVIRRWSYKVGILIGLVCYIGGCTLFFPASHMATWSTKPRRPSAKRCVIWRATRVSDSELWRSFSMWACRRRFGLSPYGWPCRWMPA